MFSNLGRENYLRELLESYEVLAQLITALEQNPRACEYVNYPDYDFEYSIISCTMCRHN